MAKDIDVQKFTSDDLSGNKLSELVSKKESFQVVSVQNISFTVNKIEGEIEKQGLSCRIYTEYRSAVMAGIFIPTGITQFTGLLSAVSTAAHNLATFNPDYEVAKNKLANTVTVIYKK